MHDVRMYVPFAVMFPESHGRCIARVHSPTHNGLDKWCNNAENSIQPTHARYQRLPDESEKAKANAICHGPFRMCATRKTEIKFYVMTMKWPSKYTHTHAHTHGHTDTHSHSSDRMAVSWPKTENIQIAFLFTWRRAPTDDRTHHDGSAKTATIAGGRCEQPPWPNWWFRLIENIKRNVHLLVWLLQFLFTSIVCARDQMTPHSHQFRS